MCRRGRPRDPEPAQQVQPLAQLRLVAAELDRQLQDNATRQANAITRASIVLAAAGVTAFANVSASLGWSLVPVTLSLVSASLCIASIRYWPSRSNRYRREHLKPHLAAAEYFLLWRQVLDKFDELEAATADLERKANYVEGALATLIAAWFTAVAITFVIDPVLSGTGY